MSWRVTLLGEIRVTQDTQEFTRFESSRVVTLLARLVLFPERIHPREQLIELLWPDVEPETGRHRLRTALSALRRQLEPVGTPEPLILADRHALRLNPSVCTCDVWELEQAIRQKRWHQARALYRGELLPGFYDDWILTERERLEAICDSLPTPTPLSPPLLPTYLTSFFGRESEKARLAELLLKQRLVTITGPGGIGKTRLATEVARTLSGEFERCAFVSFAEYFDPGGLTERLRNTLGLQSGADLRAALSEQKTLLVLDNLEHLLEAGGALWAAELLANLPLLTCLVTSRRTLGIPGEQELALAPLVLGTATEPESPAMALFLDRAHAIRPTLTRTSENQADLAAIEQLLEGVPLAIELAASRLRGFTLSELRQQLTAYFASLARSGMRHKDERHGSLHATVEWSWRLLPQTLQSFLAALSVFRGGCSANAAATVCEEPDARRLLEELVANSLAVAEEAPDGTMRFRLLEMIRSFVLERLPVLRLAELQNNHGRFFLEWSQAQGCQWHLLPREQENLQAALVFAVETGNTERALCLLKPMRQLWSLRGNSEENLLLLRWVLALPGASETQRCAGLIEAAALLITLTGGRDEARAYIQEALALATGNAELEAAVIGVQVPLDWLRYSEYAEGTKRLEYALALARESGARETEANLLNVSGILALRHDKDSARAEQFYVQSETLYEALKDSMHANYVRLNRANAALEAGDLPTALTHYGHCRQVCQVLGDTLAEIDVANSTGVLLARQLLWQDAKSPFQDCIRQAWQRGYRSALGLGLWNISEVLAHLELSEAAVQVLGFTERFWATHFSVLTAEDEQFAERVFNHCLAQLGEAQAHLLSGRGSALTLRDAVFLALEPGS